MRSACFTGHRPSKLPGGYDWNSPANQRLMTYLNAVIDNLVGEGFGAFISGGALGVDQMAAACIIEGKHYKKVSLYMALPFEGFDSKWPASSRSVLHALCDFADRHWYVCEPGYSPDKLQRRNEDMVNRSELVVAVWNGEPGGTANCITYAKKLSRSIIYINPHSYMIHRES